jgi:hypothetical protein
LVDDAQLAADVAHFLESLTVKTGKGYQCLACSCLCRDWYNQRDHVLTHITRDAGLIARLDAFILPYVLKQSSSIYSCLSCKKIIRRGMFKVRSHFISKHLNC